MRNKSIASIEERGEGEEDDMKNSVNGKQQSLLGLGASGPSQKLTASNMNLMKQQLEGRVALDEARAFKPLES